MKIGTVSDLGKLVFYITFARFCLRSTTTVFLTMENVFINRLRLIVRSAIVL